MRTAHTESAGFARRGFSNVALVATSTIASTTGLKTRLVAESGADPVFARIEAHRAAYETFEGARLRLERLEQRYLGSGECAELDEVGDRWDETSDEEADAYDALTSCTPTTLTGALALAYYVRTHERMQTRGAEDDRSWQALGVIAEAIAALIATS